MSVLGINLVYGSGGAQFHVRLPDNVPVADLLDVILRHCKRPYRPALRILHHKESGRDLTLERTLADQCIQEGHTLIARFEDAGPSPSAGREEQDSSGLPITMHYDSGRIQQIYLDEGIAKGIQEIVINLKPKGSLPESPRTQPDGQTDEIKKDQEEG
jgi:hypothetical protein